MSPNNNRSVRAQGILPIHLVRHLQKKIKKKKQKTLILKEFIYPNREGGHQVSKYIEQLNKNCVKKAAGKCSPGNLQINLKASRCC